jgi:hypothetical protein
MRNRILYAIGYHLNSVNSSGNPIKQGFLEELQPCYTNGNKQLDIYHNPLIAPFTKGDFIVILFFAVTIVITLQS